MLLTHRWMWTLKQLGLRSISNHHLDINAILEMRYPLSDQKLTFNRGHLEPLFFTVRASSYCSEPQIQVIILTEHNTKECSTQYWQNHWCFNLALKLLLHPASPIAKDAHNKGPQINWSFCKILVWCHFSYFSTEMPKVNSLKYSALQRRQIKGTSLFTRHKQLKLNTSISYQFLIAKEVLLT